MVESDKRIFVALGVANIFLLAALNFVVAAGLTFGINLLTAIPWRKAVEAHWTERARLLWPVRTSSASNVVLLPTLLALTEVMGGWATVTQNFIPWLCGFLGAFLGTFPLDREIHPRLTFADWLRLASITWVVRLSPLLSVITGMILMPVKPGWAMAGVAIGVLAAWAAFNFGLVLWLLRQFGLLHEPGERLWGIVSESALRTGQTPPVTWRLDSLFANAMAFPTTGELVFTNQLLDIMTDEEVSAITAHELAHLTESKGVLASRLAGSMRFYPLIFLQPVLAEFGPLGIAGLVCLTVLFTKMTLKLSRTMETRADAIATTSQGDEGIYARALEKLYRENKVPAVVRNARTHPHLYDRLLAAGIQPDYPRPAVPSASTGTILLWTVYGILLGLMLSLRHS